MFKERTLTYDYGEKLFGEARFAATTSSMTSVTALQEGYDTLARLEEARAYGRTRAFSNAGTLTTAMGGYEKFRSTQNKPPTFNVCSHSTQKGCNYPFTCCIYGKSRYLVYYYYRVIAADGRYVTVVPLQNHFAVDISSAQRSAWGTMQPRFEGDISMFNFIVELKDFKSLARFLMNKPIRKLSNMFKRVIRKKRFDPTKPLAELHLANEFALKPLISDIVTLAMQMDEVCASVQQNFADAGRERNSRHYSENFPVSGTNTMSAYSQTKYPHVFTGASEQLSFNATMEYSYKYNMRSSLDAFTRYYGLRPNAEAIWNALPFTFLVDYVYKVGDALKINRRDKNVLLELTQYCESLLSERTSGYHFKASRLLGPLLGVGSSKIYQAPSGNILLHGAKTTFYSRILTHPNKGAVLPRVKRPSTKQGWNVLALARCFI